mgnify:CR=1 FL=1
MGFFSNLFKAKPKKVFVTSQLGTFTLAYSKGQKHLWTTHYNELLLTVRGSEEAPFEDQIVFLSNLPAEVEKLRRSITKRFTKEFSEAGMSIDFADWSSRFKMVAIEVMLLFEGEGYWNITFEDLQEPYTHFTLYIEGEKLTDFSIDT